MQLNADLAVPVRQAPVSTAHVQQLAVHTQQQSHCNRPSRLSASLGPSTCSKGTDCLPATQIAHAATVAPCVSVQHDAGPREHSMSDMLEAQHELESSCTRKQAAEGSHHNNQGRLLSPTAAKPPSQQPAGLAAAAVGHMPVPPSSAAKAGVPSAEPGPAATLPKTTGKAAPQAPSSCIDGDDNSDDDSDADAKTLQDGCCSRETSGFLQLDNQHRPWYMSPAKLTVGGLLMTSTGLMLAGLLVHLTIDEEEFLGLNGARNIRKAYPWLYFFAACAPLLLSFRWLCWRLYKAAEYTAIREELYFLRPLSAKIAGLLFWLTILLWFQVCFKWVWCEVDLCEQPGYQEALDVVWKLLVCLALFSVANFVKCGLARLLSYSFYKTAHFKKVKEAIERELYLIRLAKARRLMLPSPLTPSPATPGTGTQCSQTGHPPGRPGWVERGSVLWNRASIVFAHNTHSDVPGAAEYSGSPAQLSDVAMHSSSSPPAAAGSSPFIAAAKRAGDAPDVRETAVDVEGVTAYVELSSRPAGATKQPKLASIDDAPLLTVAERSESSCTAAALSGQQSLPLSSKSSVHWDQKLLDNIVSNNSKKHQNPAAAAIAACPGRQASFEEFCRKPSFLGANGKGSAARLGSKGGGLWGAGSARGCSRTSKTGSRLSSRVLLPNLVPGVAGLLLQPEFVGEITSGLANTKQSIGTPAFQPAFEEEMDVLRKALGVNTYGTFVDRYYGMTPKEEAAHVRHVKRFAKVLFHNIKGNAERDHLLPSDFLIFFDGDKETAHEAFEYFDRNNDGSISCLELQESAAEMLCERKNIAASIKDTDSVVDSLETGLGLLVHFIFFIFYLLVWGINIVKGFSTFSATVLALTFVFGDSVKSVFESAIFLFVEHPYDVGDLLCMPGNITARVKKIDLMYTQMLRGTGEMVWHPNSMMREMVLVNVTRSGNKCEGHSWLVDIDTPNEVLETVRVALAAHVAANPSHFASPSSNSYLVWWKAMEEPLKMRLAVSITYSFTGDDIRRLINVRTALLGVVRKELHRQGVRYTLPSTGLGLPAAFAPAV